MATEPTTESFLYCVTDLRPGDHSHETEIDMRQVQQTLAAVARGQGPLHTP